jgi:hypothetical protein
MLSEGEVDLSQVNGGNINCIHAVHGNNRVYQAKS